MVNHLRPHSVFNLVKTKTYSRRMMKVVLPDQDAPVLLETALLLAFAKLIKPKTFFEFGTFLGVQTLNLATNLPGKTRLYTLDLDESSLKTLPQDPADAVLTKKHFCNESRLAFLGTRFASRITQLYGNSNVFDFSPYAGQMDMLYIDGGHDLETLTNDTLNSFRMLSPDRCACVAWHDYGNPAYPQVAEYLDKLSATKKIYHVEGSWLCFHLHNAPKRLLAGLEA